MFLFYFTDTKRYILHTGDFRAGASVIENPLLQNINIDIVYLDTTYLDSYYKFESQEIVIQLGVKTIKEELKKYPNSLIICGSYTIGKERVYTSLADEIGCKIYVKREKKKILDCLDDEKLKSKLTLDPNETNLHVLPMNILNMNDLTEYLAKFPVYKRVIAIKPTGWTHNSDSSLNVDSKKTNAIIYGIQIKLNS
jgi:DNA cross-link repair 1A protein